MAIITFPDNLGSGKLDSLLKSFFKIKRGHEKSNLVLNWTKVERIAPPGLAILACLFDTIIEQEAKVKCRFVKARFKTIPAVRNLLTVSDFNRMPKPGIHNTELDDFLLNGQENALNPKFIERFEEKFESRIGEDLTFSCQLILNELMQNSLDHSSADRYYAYGGLSRSSMGEEIHIGVLDMGVSIPAKLEQKYSELSDEAYLKLALKEGITTRRSRLGGLGLFHTFEHLKNSNGTLTILSRNAKLIRYFRDNTIRNIKLDSPLNGSWCLARFPLPRKK